MSTTRLEIIIKYRVIWEHVELLPISLSSVNESLFNTDLENSSFLHYLCDEVY